MIGVGDTAQALEKGQTELSLSFRHYEASRHFYDYNEENVPANAPRVERSVADLAITRKLTSRTSATLSIPFQTGRFDRSPIPPYNGSKDKASGIGDIALTFRRWMIGPEAHTRYNIRLGLGVKFPTGDYDQETDRLVNIAPRGAPAEYVWRKGPADMAIQPGDGGWAGIFSIESFYELNHAWVLYGEATYLANPRGHNGVNNQWSGAGPYVPNNVTSVPDYFLGRAGVAWASPLGWKGGGVQAGLRAEGQPVSDLIGSDAGFRRPGYSLAIEPGLSYGAGAWSVFLTVPITIYRVRWRSVDEEREGRTKAVSAAFADYNVMAGIVRRW